MTPRPRRKRGFLPSTVTEKRPDVGYQNDNIYTMFDTGTCGQTGPFIEECKRTGVNRGPETTVIPDSPGSVGSFSVNDEDSLLVNDDSRLL